MPDHREVMLMLTQNLRSQVVLATLDRARKDYPGANTVTVGSIEMDLTGGHEATFIVDVIIAKLENAKIGAISVQRQLYRTVVSPTGVLSFKFER